MMIVLREMLVVAQGTGLELKTRSRYPEVQHGQSKNLDTANATITVG